jgi:hypothetical protein
MTDPIYALIAEERRLEAIWEELHHRAEREYLDLPAAVRKSRGYTGDWHRSRSVRFAEARLAERDHHDAISRLRDAKPTTLHGVLARLDALTEVGEFDFETAVEVMQGIADRHPDIAVA